jgi:hypothetical protein
MIMRFKLPAELARTTTPVALAALAVALGGCARTASVSGRVTFNGKPLPMGRITFLGSDGRASDPGTIDEGRYEVTNAPRGECRIKIETQYLVQMTAMMAGMSGRGGRSGAADRGRQQFAEKMGQFQSEDRKKLQETVASAYVEIPTKYEDPDKSGLTFTVALSGNVCNLDLVAPPGWKPGTRTR